MSSDKRRKRTDAIVNRPSSFWQNHHATMFTLADALRRYGRMIAQREVDNAALIRRHRLERDRLLVALDALSHALG